MVCSNEEIKVNLDVGRQIDENLELCTGFLVGDFDLADLDCAVGQEFSEVGVLVAYAAD